MFYIGRHLLYAVPSEAKARRWSTERSLALACLFRADGLCLDFDALFWQL